VDFVVKHTHDRVCLMHGRAEYQNLVVFLLKHTHDRVGFLHGRVQSH